MKSRNHLVGQPTRTEIESDNSIDGWILFKSDSIQFPVQRKLVDCYDSIQPNIQSEKICGNSIESMMAATKVTLLTPNANCELWNALWVVTNEWFAISWDRQWGQKCHQLCRKVRKRSDHRDLNRHSKILLPTGLIWSLSPNHHLCFHNCHLSSSPGRCFSLLKSSMVVEGHHDPNDDCQDDDCRDPNDDCHQGRRPLYIYMTGRQTPPAKSSSVVTFSMGSTYPPSLEGSKWVIIFIPIVIFIIVRRIQSWKMHIKNMHIDNGKRLLSLSTFQISYSRCLKDCHQF